jgi:hypothetical protein
MRPRIGYRCVTQNARVEDRCSQQDASRAKKCPVRGMEPARFRPQFKKSQDRRNRRLRRLTPPDLGLQRAPSRNSREISRHFRAAHGH